MTLTILPDRVKAKSGLTGPEFDAEIAALVAELGPVIEASIDPCFLSPDAGSGVRAVLELGATEVVAGELLEQMWREPGALDRVSVGPVSVQPPSIEVLRHVLGLRERGWARLAPYLGPVPAAPRGSVLADSGRPSFRTEGS